MPAYSSAEAVKQAADLVQTALGSNAITLTGTKTSTTAQDAAYKDAKYLTELIRLISHELVKMG